VSAPTPPQALLHISWTRCDGRGLCVELLPELLTRDDWGYPVSTGGSEVPVPRRLVGAARDAVNLCPRQALSLQTLPT
jgi:ferredoxin